MARRSQRNLPDYHFQLPGLFDSELPVSPAAAKQAAKDTSDAKRRNVELQFISFGSGSSGNAAYIGIRGGGGILVDAGVDSDFIVEQLEKNYISVSDIAGIILTHDHSDHVRYAYKMLRTHKHMRLWCTPRTLTGILRRHSISNRIKDYHCAIYKEFEFNAGPFVVTPFEVSHDGTDNVGFNISCNCKHFVVATDMGVITSRADHYMRQANFLMIESNYDSAMLAVGPYPEYLKARIRSERGHLDNVVTARYLAEIWEKKLTHIYLCHLSKDNNTPAIALETNRATLVAKGINVVDGTNAPLTATYDVQLSALPRYEASPLHIHRL